MFPKAKIGHPGKNLRLMLITTPCKRCTRFCKWRDERTLLKVFEHLKRMALIPQQSKPIRAVRELKKRAKDLEVNQHIGRSSGGKNN